MGCSCLDPVVLRMSTYVLIDTTLTLLDDQHRSAGFLIVRLQVEPGSGPCRTPEAIEPGADVSVGGQEPTIPQPTLGLARSPIEMAPGRTLSSDIIGSLKRVVNKINAMVDKVDGTAKVLHPWLLGICSKFMLASCAVSPLCKHCAAGDRFGT